MPLVQLHSSVAIAEAAQGELIQAISKITAQVIGKPENYVMVTLSQGPVCMAGEIKAAAFADVRSIGGLSSSVNQKLSEQICSLLGDKLGIPGDSVYLNFTEVGAAQWGYNGSTFG